MALVVTDRERQTVTEYLGILRANVESARELLATAQRWPWKRNQRERLQREIAHDSVVIGIHEFVIGEVDQCRTSFSGAVDSLGAAEALAATRYPGYFHAQILAAGLVVGLGRRVSELAGRIFSSFDGSYKGGKALTPDDLQTELLAQRGTVALLGWFARQSATDIERWSPTSDSDTVDQFALWADCAKAGSRGDQSALETALSHLASLVTKEVQQGVFKYSEDRYVYLPGMAIIALARRDGLQVSVPRSAQWPEGILAL